MVPAVICPPPGSRTGAHSASTSSESPAQTMGHTGSGRSGHETAARVPAAASASAK